MLPWVVDLRGVVCPSCSIYFNFMQFWKKGKNNRFSYPPLELMPPLRNSGSPTDHVLTDGWKRNLIFRSRCHHYDNMCKSDCAIIWNLTYQVGYSSLNFKWTNAFISARMLDCEKLEWGRQINRHIIVSPAAIHSFAGPTFPMCCANKVWSQQIHWVSIPIQVMFFSEVTWRL